MTCTDEVHQAAARQLEITEAHLKVASLALDKLTRVVTRIGGFLTSEDQAVLADAKVALELIGYRRADRPAPWVDRKCTCTEHPMAPGKWIRDYKCEIESHRAAATTRPKGG